jgi:xylulokinase
VGGGARSVFWAQMIADVTGLTIDLAESAEAGAALGAARLAMLAVEAGDEAAICTRPAVQRSFAPQAERTALLAPRLRRYRALYPAEKGARG